MDRLDALDRADREFARRLAVVREDQWDEPTPCDRWPVRVLVNHVIGGHRMAVALLAGASADEGAALIKQPFPDDPVSAFDEVSAELAAGFSGRGDLGETVHHPMGDMPAGQLLAFRYADALLHAWDLARGIGADETLDPDVVAFIWADLEPMAAWLPQTGMFGPGPSGDVGPDADLQTRLLDLTGRRP
jgi:uncharacterized protein (TIGR03086 family)